MSPLASMSQVLPDFVAINSSFWIWPSPFLSAQIQAVSRGWSFGQRVSLGSPGYLTSLSRAIRPHRIAISPCRASNRYTARNDPHMFVLNSSRRPAIVRAMVDSQAM
jgi:hypothetical protein